MKNQLTFKEKPFHGYLDTELVFTPGRVIETKEEFTALLGEEVLKAPAHRGLQTIAELLPGRLGSCRTPPRSELPVVFAPGGRAPSPTVEHRAGGG